MMEADTLLTHPAPVPNPHHRKIELQSPLDLTYLRSALATSARQKLDLHFPIKDPSGAGRDADPMRARVEQLVAQFLDRTWEAAREGISVNGADATGLVMGEGGGGDGHGAVGEREGVDYEYEAYDPRLSERVASLYAQVEGLTTEVAKKRRTVPQEAALQYERLLGEVLEREKEVRREEESGEGGEGLKLDQVREGWQEDVEGVYARGLGELARLGGHTARGGEAGIGSGASLTETVGRAQRARTVAMELE